MLSILEACSAQDIRRQYSPFGKSGASTTGSIGGETQLVSLNGTSWGSNGSLCLQNRESWRGEDTALAGLSAHPISFLQKTIITGADE